MDKIGRSAETVKDAPTELVLRSGQLKPGMVLSRDLVAASGELLLSKGYALSASVIEQIMGFERMEGHPLTIYVHEKN